MRYSEQAAVNRVYELLAGWLEPPDPDAAQPVPAMTVAAALAEFGEVRSWASVWWAYGALHHDLSDDALARALELLQCVERPEAARAAALMLQAEIRYSQAVYADSTPSATEQLGLLQQAVELIPHWPAIHVRLARACKARGDDRAAEDYAARAMALLREFDPTEDPFDAAISGLNLDRAYVADELERLGLIPSS